ncbi:MAG: DsbA family oxidoreductase [Candidatus Abyssobacteria bacterium SURF_17]|uniref:DsbA family oxidoreductase n=1 Tax=Candidatus Abyssobacteria bacterium SURF_17 TaxID=2093361 RepID=A0A419EXT6_9BACT|nr:MAG: DsbA family oxidoreductase [Candidatus Abyssubacteria bacterium SURF_17]
MRIERLRKNYVIEVRWTAFPLHPDTPEGGLTLQELFRGRPIDLNAVKAHLKQVADELGLPLADRERTFNSRLAQELAKWAESRGKGGVFHEAVFRAFFAEGRNISNVDELVAIAKSTGLPENEARSVLESRKFRPAVDSDWLRSRELGITAVPTFVVGRRAIVGAQPYEVLEQFLKTSGVKEREAED